ncbi:MAG: hypothetical protein V1929_00365 [bacterium]
MDYVESFWLPGRAVAVKKDGVQVFAGRLERQRRSGSGQSEKLIWTVVGNGWWHFENTVYEVIYDFTNLEQASITRWTLGGMSLLAQVTAILQFGGARGQIAIGTVDLPTITIPQQDVRDLTIAEGLRQLLRWCPGAQVIFDYSVTPPTCHVLRPDSLALQHLTVTIGQKATLVDYEKRDDLVIPNVILLYERQVDVRQRQWDNSTASVDTQWVEWEAGLLDYYPAGQLARQLKSIYKTIQLAGNKRKNIFRFRQGNWNASLATTGVLYFETPANAWQMFTSRPTWWIGSSTNYVLDELSRQAYAQVGDPPASGAFYVSADRFKLLDGGIVASPGFPTEMIRSAGFLDGFEVWQVSYRAKVRCLSTGEIVTMVTQTKWINTRHTDTGAVRDNQWITRTDLEEDAVLESAPSGIAQQLYDLLNAVAYQGTVSLMEDEVSFASPTTRKLRLLLGGSELASGPVQRMVFRVSTGVTTINFGYPSHLGVQDLIAIQQLNVA